MKQKKNISSPFSSVKDQINVEFDSNNSYIQQWTATESIKCKGKDRRANKKKVYSYTLFVSLITFMNVQ